MDENVFTDIIGKKREREDDNINVEFEENQKKRRKIDESPIIPKKEAPPPLKLENVETKLEEDPLSYNLPPAIPINPHYDAETPSYQWFANKSDGTTSWEPAQSLARDEYDDESYQVPKRKKKKAKKYIPPGERKTSQFKNIFYGNQQEAWMGSIRVKGVIVRSCSRKSDLMAAKILNTRCRNKGLEAPNIEAGFLSSAELASHTQVRRKRRSKKNPEINKHNLVPPASEVKRERIGKSSQYIDMNADFIDPTASDFLDSGHRLEMLDVQYSPKVEIKQEAVERTCPYKNVFWDERQHAWLGNVSYNGYIVRSCSRHSAESAAKDLNFRCQSRGLPLPNPEVGFLSQEEYKTMASACQSSSLSQTEEFNFDSEDTTYKGFSRIPDAELRRLLNLASQTTDDMPVHSPRVEENPLNLDLNFPVFPNSTLPNSLFNNFDTSASIQPAVEPIENDTFRRMNETLMSAILERLDSTDPYSEGTVDDLPFNNAWRTELLSQSV